MPDNGIDNVRLLWRTLEFTGDGTKATQVFSIGGPALNDAGRQASVRFSNIPAGTRNVVNVTGASANLNLNSLLSGETGLVLDTGTAEFGQIASNLVWNLKDASSVVVDGNAQVPGSIFVSHAASFTTISAKDTNGRILVDDNLEHIGTGGNEMHAYPLIGALECVVEGDMPETPVTPPVPGEPETPELPKTSEVPAEPELPLVPADPGQPDVPLAPATVSLSVTGAAPAVDGLAKTGANSNTLIICLAAGAPPWPDCHCHSPAGDHDGPTLIYDESLLDAFSREDSRWRSDHGLQQPLTE